MKRNSYQSTTFINRSPCVSCTFKKTLKETQSVQENAKQNTQRIAKTWFPTLALAGSTDFPEKSFNFKLYILSLKTIVIIVQQTLWRFTKLVAPFKNIFKKTRHDLQDFGHPRKRSQERAESKQSVGRSYMVLRGFDMILVFFAWNCANCVVEYCETKYWNPRILWEKTFAFWWT